MLKKHKNRFRDNPREAVKMEQLAGVHLSRRLLLKLFGAGLAAAGMYGVIKFGLREKEERESLKKHPTKKLNH